MEAKAEKLFHENVRLVYRISRRFYSRVKAMNLDMEDIHQEGMIGLIKASERFDESLGWKFSTYAHQLIAGEMIRYIRDKGALVRLPRLTYENALKTGTLDDVRVKVSHLEATLNFDSNDGELTVADLIGVEDDFTRVIVDELLDSLDERLRTIAALRMEDMTQTKIGAFLGVSQVQASREVGRLRRFVEKEQAM